MERYRIAKAIGWGLLAAGGIMLGSTLTHGAWFWAWKHEPPRVCPWTPYGYFPTVWRAWPKPVLWTPHHEETLPESESPVPQHEPLKSLPTPVRPQGQPGASSPPGR